MTVMQAARELEPDRSATSCGVRSSKDRGFCGIWRAILAIPLPEGSEMLLKPHKPKAYKACTRAGETGGDTPPPPPKTAKKDQRRGEGLPPPENECTPARLVCLQGSGGRRSAKTSKVSDGMNWIAQPQDLSLKSPELAEKHRRYPRRKAYFADDTDDTDGNFEREELRMCRDLELTESAEDLPYRHYRHKI